LWRRKTPPPVIPGGGLGLFRIARLFLSLERSSNDHNELSKIQGKRPRLQSCSRHSLMPLSFDFLS